MMFGLGTGKEGGFHLFTAADHGTIETSLFVFN